MIIEVNLVHRWEVAYWPIYYGQLKTSLKLPSCCDIRGFLLIEGLWGRHS